MVPVTTIMIQIQKLLQGLSPFGHVLSFGHSEGHADHDFLVFGHLQQLFNIVFVEGPYPTCAIAQLGRLKGEVGKSNSDIHMMPFQISN